ncbi:hypothetical protein BGW38_006934 [Lunasporangiospora selenospora]|uniref:lipoyl(octanoyl) transferase n=1 Tax=Lunasporangiospora selenospora TaxID=979761 RepID=A0A9P6KAN4_9FUNG|nr:hypothetical protein BGW38_006934 [Lunasporangiospora selenospora]
MNSTSTSTSTSVSESTNSGEACSGTLPRPHLAPLPFIYLRNLPYLRSLDLQQLLVDRQIRLRQQQEQRQEGSDAPKSSEDLLLLVEHPPTYTNGRRNRGVKGLGEEEVIRLQKLGANYVETLRGGEITFHGPGQLVAYPILDIKASQLSVRCYVSFLEKAIIATCAEWGLKAMTTENTGVWINDQQKIAAIGN